MVIDCLRRFGFSWCRYITDAQPEVGHHLRAVDRPFDETAIRQPDGRRRVDHHEVIVETGFLQETFEPCRIQQLVRRDARFPGGQHRQVESLQTARDAGALAGAP